MSDDIKRVRALVESGLCCTQVLVAMGLEARGEENAQMVDAVATLCGGMRIGKLCGALSGGACMLGLFNKELARDKMVPELSEWFQEAYGNVDCLEILKGDMQNRVQVCPGLIENVYLQAKEILFENGFDLDEMREMREMREESAKK